jgi:lysozyme family protein
MTGGFETALALTLHFEGGTADNPGDPGGLTRFGVTQATLTRWLKRPAARAEVLALTRETASAIYRRFYWEAIGGDALPPGVDMALFDFAVHSGPATAIRALQQLLKLKADGVIGPLTLAALGRADPALVVGGLCDARLGLFRRLPGFSRFARGWTSRVETLRRAALARCGAAAHPQPSLSSPTKDASMDQFKSFFSSRTIWANIVGFVALLLPLLGYKTDGLDSGQVVDAISQIVAGLSFIASTVFRVAATKKIAG